MTVKVPMSPPCTSTPSAEDKEMMEKFFEFLKAAHYTNLYVRINGEDVNLEADWLKYIPYYYGESDEL